MLADFAMADAASCWMALSCFLFVLLSPSLDFVALARPDCPSSLSPGAVHTWSRAEELLHEIGQDCSTPAVQVKAVAMQTPAISLSNLIMTLVQDKLSEHIAIEWQKVEARECTSRRGEDELVHPLVEGKVAHRFLARNVLEDGAVLLNTSVGFGLEGKSLARIFPNGDQRAEGDGCLRLALEATHQGLHRLAVPLR